MAKMYYAKDCDINYLNGKKIAIIGYGSQGHAHALNLKDSGCDVCVGLRAGSKNWKNAEEAGLKVMTIPEAAKWGDIVMILTSGTSPPTWRRATCSCLPTASTSTSSRSCPPPMWT